MPLSALVSAIQLRLAAVMLARGVALAAAAALGRLSGGARRTVRGLCQGDEM
jgi:hypothetical protein